MPTVPRSSPPLAPHVLAAIGAGLQAKTAPRRPGTPAPHVQRAVQATLQTKPASPAARAVAPHVQAAVSRSPLPRQAAPSPTLQRKARGPATRSIQPCSALLHTLTCGLLGSPAAVTNNNVDDGVSLLETGQSDLKPSQSSKKKAPATTFLSERDPPEEFLYGRAAQNVGTTTCGLVIVHTDGSKAVGYHWPYCQESSTYKGLLDGAISNVNATSIEVVVNGGRYRTGDTGPVEFKRYLQKNYNLSVSVYRQVYNRNDSDSDQDPWVIVERGRLTPVLDGYELVAV